MAFVRRKGKAFFLEHNVRQGGKVRQIHLARLGARARITDEVVRLVSKKHPFVELNWKALREELRAVRAESESTESIGDDTQASTYASARGGDSESTAAAIIWNGYKPEPKRSRKGGKKSVAL